MDTRHSRPWTDASADAELLPLAQSGDLAALLRIYNTHRLALWRACLALTRHAGEAERLFQETIVRATRAISDAPAGQPLRPWLVGLARELESARASEHGPARTGTRRPNGKAWDDGSSSAQDTQVEQRALQAFARLHADDQRLLALRLFERLSYEDIARVTGLAAEQVAQRLAIARESIDAACGSEENAA